ncbi:MAG: light-harvesting protein [Tabrizicola sp.]|nr:light-harvesting protein [Tabrizicola sp.]
MNNAKMWLVVKPTVGVPLFLTAVAVGSFAVHVAVLSNTTWVADFLSGKPLGTGMAALELEEQKAATVAYMPQGTQEVLVTLPDGRVTKAILQLPETMAALE